jgi:hypothetical protein
MPDSTYWWLGVRRVSYRRSAAPALALASYALIAALSLPRFYLAYVAWNGDAVTFMLLSKMIAEGMSGITYTLVCTSGNRASCIWTQPDRYQPAIEHGHSCADPRRGV